MDSRPRCCVPLPKSPGFWHCLTILFVICLLANGIIYFGNFQTTLHWNSYNNKQTEIVVRNFSSANQSAKTTLATVKPINPHNYNYILNEPKACTESTHLIIMVCTSINNFDQRQTIRETWGSVGNEPQYNITVLYLVGSGVPKDMQLRLENESRIYHDIIQEDFKDSYRNLSIKSQAMLKWVSTYCMTAKYLLKADDDMYVNIPNLLTALHKQKDAKFILGVTFIGAQPVQSQSSKWYTPKKDFNEKYYPKYTSGTSYSMSTSAVPDLYKASLEIKMFWLEDIYITGICARKAGIKRINDFGFHYVKMPAKGCVHSKSVTGHRNNMTEIRKIHKELKDPNLNCTKP